MEVEEAGAMKTREHHEIIVSGSQPTHSDKVSFLGLFSSKILIQQVWYDFDTRARG